MAAPNGEHVPNTIPLAAPTQYVLLKLFLLSVLSPINKLEMVMSLIVSFDRHIILVMLMLYFINLWIKCFGLFSIFTTIVA